MSRRDAVAGSSSGPLWWLGVRSGNKVLMTTKIERVDEEDCVELGQDTLYDAVRGMPSGLLQEICRLAGGACYVISAERVAESVRTLAGALQSHYPRSRVAYSYKTNYHRSFIAAARSEGALSEVVSETEWQYAEGMGVPDEEIVLNGPGKTASLLRRAMGRRVTVIADSVGELGRMAGLMKGGQEMRARLGVRVNPAMSFQKGPSRFGVDFRCREQREALRRLVEDGLPLVGIHLHLTDDRGIPAFLERLDHLMEAWHSVFSAPPAFLDCGGGFASGMPETLRNQLGYEVATLAEYGDRIGRRLAELFPAGGVEFLCEPGTGILADAGVVVTPVLDVKTCGGRSLAVVDGTYFTMNPLRSAARPLCALIPSGETAESVPPPVGIYGNSCMDIDRLVDDFGSSVGVGDILIFGQKGAYAACMASPFIQGIPAVVALDGSSFRLLRSRTGHELLSELNGPGSSDHTFTRNNPYNAPTDSLARIDHW
jgi:diaminopimelate decarboxylase